MVKKAIPIEGEKQNSSVGNLMHLCPQYDETQHSMHVKLLECAVYQDSLSNVALAGPYGSGKSSILNSFREQHSDRCISVGLSTLAPKSIDGESRDPLQGNSIAKFSCSTDQDGLTNELEREIVRQLLYQGNPAKTPKSRFNRIHPTPVGLQITMSVLASLAAVAILSIIIYCSDNTANKLLAWVSLARNHLPILAFIIFTLVLCLTPVVFKFIAPKWHRIKIGGLSTMGATIKLEEGSFSYFDQYLDEILYYFEANNYDTVIFEDLDRFNNPFIFEQLKELNSLLNNAHGIKTQGKKVHFIYALRDSVFEPDSFESSGEHSSSESKGDTILGSGRVKFFDEVIPLMPFLSDLSAYDHMKAIFTVELESIHDDKEREEFDRCLRTAAPNLADMRLIKAIHNEYLVLSDQMGPRTTRGANLGLHESALLAMTIFKNIHPREFEKARVGDGWLNKVYRAYYGTVEGRMSTLKQELSWCSGSELADKTLEERSVILGDKLNQALYNIYDANPDLTIRSNTYDSERVKSPEFWKVFISSPDDEKIAFNNAGVYHRTYGTFSKAQLTLLMNLKNEDLSYIKAASNPEMRKKELQAEIDALSGTDYPDIKTLICHNEEKATNEECTFEEMVNKTAPGDLASKLIVNGFIGNNFRLYTSLFPDEGRASVINFITNHINLNKTAIDFPLDKDDCADLVKRLGMEQYENASTFNCDLLSYLVSHEQDYAKKMVRSACKQFDGEGKQLLERFITDRSEDCWLNDTVLGVMSNELITIIPLIIDGIIPREQRLKAMFFALGFLREGKSYSVDGFARWLESCWKTLDLDKTLITHKAFRNALAIFEISGFEAPTLSNIDDSFAQEIVDRGLFVVSHDNLKIATTESSVPPLEHLFNQHRSVFDRILRNSDSIEEYLSCLEAGEFAFKSFEHKPFITCIRLVDPDGALLEKLIKACSKDMFIDDVCDLADEILDTNALSLGTRLLNLLVDRGHINPTSHNVSCIMGAAKNAGISSDVSHAVNLLLANQAFKISGGLANDADVNELIRAIARCKGLNNDDAAGRIESVYNTYADGSPFSVNDILNDLENREELLVQLLELGVVEKPVDVYIKLRNAEWKLRERCLVETLHEKESIEADILFPEDVALIIQSKKINNTTLRNHIINDPKGTLDQCNAAANDYADTAIALSVIGHTPSNDMLKSALDDTFNLERLDSWLSLNTIPQQYKIGAVACCASRLASHQFESSLEKLGGQYAKINDRKTRYVKLEATQDNETIAYFAERLLRAVSSVTRQDDKSIRINKHTAMLR